MQCCEMFIFALIALEIKSTLEPEQRPVQEDRNSPVNCKLVYTIRYYMLIEGQVRVVSHVKSVWTGHTIPHA